MNSRSRNLYLLLSLVAMAACAPRPQHDTTIERTWPAAGIRRVEVHEIDGNVQVDGSTSGEVSLVAHVRSSEDPRPKEQNQGYFETSQDGDSLVIGRHGERRIRFIGFNLGPDTSINYTLHVPSSVALVLHTVNGRIATQGVDAGIEAHTVNGEINVVASGRGEVDAKTVNGRVYTKFLSDFQGARLKTVNGRVQASLPPSASFACDLSQVNGDFEASFPLSIHSHRGSRRVSGEVNGGQHELRISTVNGDITLEHAPVPPVPPTPVIPAPVPPAPPAAPAAPANSAL